MFLVLLKSVEGCVIKIEIVKVDHTPIQIMRYVKEKEEIQIFCSNGFRLYFAFVSIRMTFECCKDIKKLSFF